MEVPACSAPELRAHRRHLGHLRATSTFVDKRSGDAELIRQRLDPLRASRVGGAENEIAAGEVTDERLDQRLRIHMHGMKTAIEIMRNALAMQIEQHILITEHCRWNRR